MTKKKMKARPGRRRKPAGEARTERVSVQLKPAEFRMIEKAGGHPATYLREVGVAQAIKDLNQ